MKRGRGGEHPDFKVKTTEGETWRLRHDGDLLPDRPSISVAQTDAQVTVTIQAQDLGTTLNMLKRVAKQLPEIDPNVAIHDALNVEGYLDKPLAMSFRFGGPKSGRSVVKSALALLSAAGVDKADCQHALEYLKNDDPDARAPYGHYFLSDLVLNRPLDHLFHCVSVIGQPEERRILAYVEFFDCARFLILIGDGYSGDGFQLTYAIDPVHRNDLDIKVDFGRVVGPIESAVITPQLPPPMVIEAMSRAQEKVMSRLTTRAIERAMKEATAEVGLTLDDTYPSEEQSKRLMSCFLARVRGYVEATMKVSGMLN